MNRKVLPAAVLLALSHPLFAQVSTLNQETELDPIITTANRVARTADETLASVSVITRKDIEQQQAQSVPDLLRGLPGVSFSNNGGPGKATSLYLRGTNDSHTLVLIDGVKVGSATAGTASLQDIPVDQIERIEVVRGPRASLYGSEAIGGVIQIFTRKGPSSPSLSITGGSRSSFGGAGQASIGSDSAWLSAGVSGNSTRGINARQASEPDRDGYRNEALNLRSGFKATDTLSFDLHGMQTTGHNDYDGTPNESYNRQELVSASARYTPTDRLSSTLRLAENRDLNRNYTDGAFFSEFETLHNQASWENAFTVAQGHTLTGGIDLTRDRVYSDSTFDTTSRTNRAIFGQYIADIGAFGAEIAGRHDDNEQFGTHNSGSMALSYAIVPAVRVYGSYGTAFKAPTFNDLYYPLDAYGSHGNPSLSPETSRTSELGASGKYEKFQWQASVFHTKVDDLINWAFVGGGYTPTNVSKAEINGFEFSATQRWTDTTIKASATLLDPRDRSGGTNDGKYLTRRARQTGRIDLDHTVGQWRFGTTLTGVGKRYDNAANTVKLGGYATLDLRAEYQINTDWRVQARVENVLDKRYETASNYNQPGVGAFVTFRYQPK